MKQFATRPAKVTGPEAPPVRPERHVPNSIATLADGSTSSS